LLPRLVVEVSVVVKWFAPEPGSGQAVLLRSQHLLAPDLLVAELGNALWKKVMIGEISAQDAHTAVTTFVATTPVSLYPPSTSSEEHLTSRIGTSAPCTTRSISRSPLRRAVNSSRRMSDW